MDVWESLMFPLSERHDFDDRCRKPDGVGIGRDAYRVSVRMDYVFDSCNIQLSL